MAKDNKGNATIRILAVLIAIIMWFYVMSEINPEITKEFTNVKVDFKYIESVEEANLYILEPNEVEITVKLKGRRDDVMQITEEDIKPYLDLRGSTVGEMKALISVPAPNKLEVVDFYPKEAIFKMDDIIMETKQVTLKKIGKVASEFTTGEEILDPSSVNIRGPRSKVNLVNQVVATIDITNLKEGKIENLPYKILDDRGNEINGLEKEPESIEVNIPVYKVKSVSIEAGTNGELAEGYKITDIKVSPQNIFVMGSVEAISAISFIKTADIDISSLTETQRVDADLDIPDGVQLLSSTYYENPPKVTIMIEPIIEKTFEYTIKDVTFINMKENLERDDSESTSKLTITIKGIESVIGDITRSDITPYIDLEDLEEGQYDLEIKALIEEGIEIADKSPETVRIILKQIPQEEIPEEEIPQEEVPQEEIPEETGND